MSHGKNSNKLNICARGSLLLCTSAFVSAYRLARLGILGFKITNISIFPCVSRKAGHWQVEAAVNLRWSGHSLICVLGNLPSERVGISVSLER